MSGTVLQYDKAEFFNTEDAAMDRSNEAMEQLPEGWKMLFLTTVDEPPLYTFAIISHNDHIHIQPYVTGTGYLAYTNTYDRLSAGPFTHPGKAAMAIGIKVRNEVQRKVLFLERVCEALDGLDHLEEEVEQCLTELTRESDLPRDSEPSSENDSPSFQKGSELEPPKTAGK